MASRQFSLYDNGEQCMGPYMSQQAEIPARFECKPVSHKQSPGNRIKPELVSSVSLSLQKAGVPRDLGSDKISPGESGSDEISPPDSRENLSWELMERLIGGHFNNDSVIHQN